MLSFRIQNETLKMDGLARIYLQRRNFSYSSLYCVMGFYLVMRIHEHEGIAWWAPLFKILAKYKDLYRCLAVNIHLYTLIFKQWCIFQKMRNIVFFIHTLVIVLNVSFRKNEFYQKHLSKVVNIWGFIFHFFVSYI